VRAVQCHRPCALSYCEGVWQCHDS
jgi:hypothetical protein